MYTFIFRVGNIIPKSVKCIHSATKGSFGPLGIGFGASLGRLLAACRARRDVCARLCKARCAAA